MKRRVAIASALAFSIGLHAFLILAGRGPKPPLDAAAARVPDRMYYVSIRFPGEAGADPVQSFVDSLAAPEARPKVLR
jgi:hypothetical protein